MLPRVVPRWRGEKAERREGGEGEGLFGGFGLRQQVRAGPADEAGVDIACREGRQAAEAGEETGIGRHARNAALRERAFQPGERFGAGAAVGDDLGDHRVVIGRDEVARAHAGIDPHALRQVEDRKTAGRGQEVARRVFRIKPRFEGPAVDGKLVLPLRQGLTGGDAELPFDEIEAGDRLRHGMLDLEARVHLHEMEAVLPQSFRNVGDELDGAGAAIADGGGGAHGGSAHRGAHLGRHAGGRGLLDHLLVPALERAVALEEMHDVAVRIAEDLHLDMAGLGHVFFHQDAPVAEGAFRLAPGAFQRGDEVFRPLHLAHALAAASGPRLDQHGIADGLRLAGEEGRLLPLAVIAGDDGNARLLHQGLGGVLQAHGADGIGRGADEDEAGGLHRLHELGIFREEAVTRMHRLRAARPGGLDDGGDVQVAFRRLRRADVHRFVGKRHMQRVAVGIGMDGDRRDTHAAGGADDAAGDFATVGDEDLAEHAASYIRKTPKRVGSIGTLSAAESESASTSRVLRGSTMPSSHSRAEA